MSHVTCPYCKLEREIDHEDVNDESVEYHQDCSCGKTFIFTIQITINCNVYCQDGDHKMEKMGTISGFNGRAYSYCKNCDKRKNEAI